MKYYRPTLFRHTRGRGFGPRRHLICVLTLATALFLTLPPRQAYAEVTTATVIAAIALLAHVASALVSLGDSGANPYGTMTAQQRQMLTLLHTRVTAHDHAVKAILQKLDAMPKWIREEVDDAFTVERIHAVRAAIMLILEDMKVMENLKASQEAIGRRDLTPIADASSRLANLQNTARRLFHVKDDLIVFDVISALYVEHAMIAMQPPTEASADWPVRKGSYRVRLEKMLSNPWRPHSLPRRLFAARNNAAGHLSHWTHEVDSAIAELYVRSGRQLTNCESEVSYTITDVAKLVHSNMTGRDELNKDRLSVMQRMDAQISFLEYTISVIQYELEALSLSNPVPPARSYPRLLVSTENEERFLSLRRRMNDAVTGIPATEVYFRSPPGTVCM